MGAEKKKEKDRKKAKSTGRTPEIYNDQIGENASEGRIAKKFKK